MTILVVDDAAFSRGMICNYLNAAGFETEQASDGQNALEMVQTASPGHYALIITDMLMPRMTGVELLAALTEANISIPVIVVTADIQATTRQECEGLGCVEFMNKPVTPGPLREAVERAVAPAKATG
ncbi:MAG: response regulator [Myxococcales bacterium FL481]|nr:MAG: response regulator [Myxococcales bacterium FL481]